MVTVFPAHGDPVLGYQLSEIPSQAIPLLPTPLPLMQPSQGTIYFQPPYVFPCGLPQPVSCDQPNVTSSLENTSREGPTNDSTGMVQEAAPELTSSAVFYMQAPFSIPFSPPVHPIPVFSPYIHPSAVFFVLPSFSDTSVPLPSLSRLPSVCPKSLLTQSFSTSSPAHQSWPTTNATSQNSTVRMTSKKDCILLTGANQSSLNFSVDECRDFQRGSANRSELTWRNRSGPSLNNYRTKHCINFKNGHCSYGDNCRFIHHQTSDSVMKTKFSTNAPAFVPKANAMLAKPNSPSASFDMIPSNRLYSSTPVSLLTKGHGTGMDMKERSATPIGRRVSYRQDFSAGYRRPSVADGPHPLPTC